MIEFCLFCLRKYFVLKYDFLRKSENWAGPDSTRVPNIQTNTMCYHINPVTNVLTINVPLSRLTHTGCRRTSDRTDSTESAADRLSPRRSTHPQNSPLRHIRQPTYTAIYHIIQETGQCSHAESKDAGYAKKYVVFLFRSLYFADP